MLDRTECPAASTNQAPSENAATPQLQSHSTPPRANKGHDTFQDSAPKSPPYAPDAHDPPAPPAHSPSPSATNPPKPFHETKAWSTLPTQMNQGNHGLGFRRRRNAIFYVQVESCRLSIPSDFRVPAQK